MKLIQNLKIPHLIIIILAFSFNGFGQNSNKFAGIIKVQDSLLITYRLEFEESNGLISGFSLTDFGGEHETKSRVSGTYDDNKRLIEFKEVELIYTKSPVDQQDFCNIHLKPTKFKLGSTKLFGDFLGKFSDGTECINGEIAMNSVEKIQKRVNKFTKKVKKSNRIPDSVKQIVNNIKILDTLNLNVLKKNQTTSVLTASSIVKVIIYDGGQMDNDIISIKKNGKFILSKYTISKDRKVIELPINTDIVKLEVISESVGTIGSNTAIIEILDGKNKIKTMTNLNKGEVTKIDIIKRKF